VALTGKQRAALLLASLDAATAAEMLKGVDANIVQELAVELSYLDAAGQRNARQTAEIARQFCKSLQDQSGFQFRNFLREMLRNTVGEDKAKQIQHDVQDLLQKRDPFLTIRSASVETLAAVLETEHPQAVAVVLSELPPKRSSEILGRLGEGIRISTISRMTSVGTITPEAKARIAETVRRRLEGASTGGQAGVPAVQAQPDQAMRKVAIIVRNLDKDVRDGVLAAVRQKDKDAADKIAGLMIVWEDIPSVSDRTMQQGLRGFEERQLALALHGAAQEIIDKIKSNISERAATIVNEEASLMSSPKKDDVRQARDKIVNALRDLNSKGELTFVEE
jgi:flagellar motor switch protein FliG